MLQNSIPKRELNEWILFHIKTFYCGIKQGILKNKMIDINGKMV